MDDLSPTALLRLQQLTSSALPVGAYSYSEGLETLVEQGAIASAEDLQAWIAQELQGGSIGMEAAILCRAYEGVVNQNPEQLCYWNQWWSAARETQELREQSWFMGRSLLRLLRRLDASLEPWFGPLERSTVSDSGTVSPGHVNWIIGFGIAAAHWNIDRQATILGYLHSWVTNLVGAAVKLVPLGQTEGQQILLDLNPVLINTAQAAIAMGDEDLCSCSWGVALASSQHERQKVRLFQS